jgi:hypothetical protein
MQFLEWMTRVAGFVALGLIVLVYIEVGHLEKANDELFIRLQQLGNKVQVELARKAVRAPGAHGAQDPTSVASTPAATPTSR